jgi:hypothetical protein
MTSTVEIIKTLLKNEIDLEVLRTINAKDYILADLFKALPEYSEQRVTLAAVYLDKVALTENVFRRGFGSFYKISARGKKILEITEEAVIEEADTNG